MLNFSFKFKKCKNEVNFMFSYYSMKIHLKMFVDSIIRILEIFRYWRCLYIFFFHSILWKILIGCVLWYINPFRLFNGRFCLYMYIKYIEFVNE